MKTLLLCWLLLCIPLESAEASSPVPESLGTRTLSDQDLASIRAIASSYPCAMLTLLYLMREPGATDNGVLYIDTIPTSATVGGVLDDLHAGSIGALALALQANLYSDVSTFTELRWTSTEVEAGTWRLDFRAELLARAGPPLIPRHILETAVQIVVAPDSVSLRPPLRDAPAASLLTRAVL
jgi:hypothetical protein